MPGRLITNKLLDNNSSKPSRRNKRKTENQIKSESPASPSAQPTQEALILPQSALCSLNKSRLMKRTRSFQSSSDRMSTTTDKVAAVTSTSAACSLATYAITANIAGPEAFSSYYHVATYEDAGPNTTTETMQAQTPSPPNTLRSSEGRIAMPENPAPCTAVSHPATKGCRFCLSGWCLNDQVTACTSCNVDRCICETPPSQASPTLSAVSQSAEQNGRSPKRRKTADDFRPTTQVENMRWNMDDSSPFLQTWNSFSSIHPSLLSLRARTPSPTQEQESLDSSYFHVWASSPTTVRSSPEVNNGSPAHCTLLSFGFEELPWGGEEIGFENELAAVSQFNDDWDAINYPRS